MSENKNIKKVNRKKTRKYLYQKIYAITFSKQNEKDFEDTFFWEVFDFELDKKYLEEMEKLILEKEWYLLKIISLLAPKFNVELMWNHYIIPIFIWATEMLYLKEEIPAKVSINEAVELAKVYWDESSKKIVNGVLNKLFENIEDIKKQLEDFDWDFWVNLLKR